ncbi:MAG: aminotransferase class V-fold PLP-dependent enzyme, partial [Cyanobacteria bacterium NC_groundwater_1444_Ag_S-0.65um_54_12]|nr:aminotransferase class V-fold PLP-dependent enzyme [Cyanobacteria bacterium NC_groundwater_1444_Ag_S-0.65um_54_12]
MIYLDYHATTPVDPAVLEAMLPYFCEKFGNAASRGHRYGWDAEAAVEKAREQVAKLINASPAEIIWTSGATESDNLAIMGVCDLYAEKGNHVITQATEHPAVLDTCAHWERKGGKVTILPTDSYGQIAIDQLKNAITDRTILISIMHANNEIGTLQPSAEIGRIAKEYGVLFHTDAAQSAGKVTIDVMSMNIDLLSLSAHKLYGPKGIGALYVRRKNPRVQLQPLIHGGGQERGMRSGTLAVPNIVGLGKACEIATQVMHQEASRIATLREKLFQDLVAEVGDVV